MDLQDELRKLPSVDALLQSPQASQLVAAYGRDVVVQAARQVTAEVRTHILAGGRFAGQDAVTERLALRAGALVEPTLAPVINATGVVLHTNLGRAPLSAEVLVAMQRVGAGYSNLEFDLEAGKRGSRYVHAEDLIRRLTGAEAALLVNNNAGAVLLALSCLAVGRRVVISRGHLVEIGGGFRIPDVMAQSGAYLVEVGTTDRTRIGDYEKAIDENTAALMRVHASNFRTVGFTEQASLGELVSLAHKRDLLMLDDLGSGTLLDTAPYGLEHEPTIQESVRAGADLVTFSGDKLLGGPQAGIIVGKQELIARLERHPLTRALRVDKTTIAGIQANLLHYVRGEAVHKVPVWRMIAMDASEIADRARRLVQALDPLGKQCDLVEGESMVGGGSLPGEVLPTYLIAVRADDAAGLARDLRLGSPAVVTRVRGGSVLLDLRTVLPTQESLLRARLVDALKT